MSTELEAVSPRPVALNIFENYPSLRSRIEKAVELYKGNAVVIGRTAIEVMSQEGMEIYLVPSDLSSCTCADFPRAPLGVCKHILASSLLIAAHVELPAKKLPRIIKKLRAAARKVA